MFIARGRSGKSLHVSVQGPRFKLPGFARTRFDHQKNYYYLQSVSFVLRKSNKPIPRLVVTSSCSIDSSFLYRREERHASCSKGKSAHTWLPTASMALAFATVRRGTCQVLHHHAKDPSWDRAVAVHQEEDTVLPVHCPDVGEGRPEESTAWNLQISRLWRLGRVPRVRELHQCRMGLGVSFFSCERPGC